MQLPVLSDNPGIIIYKGPSAFNGEEIVVIVTGWRGSDNPKTGKTLQTWIIVPNQSPLEAHQEGNDKSVCGNCKHMYFGSCYVNLIQGPNQVWNTYQAGRYLYAKPEHLELFRDKVIRLGSYGEPAAVPIGIWDSLASVVKGWLGYTHTWRQKQFQAFKKYCMASCDTEQEARDAMFMGWKPFYVRDDEHDPIPDGFFSCPASKEENHRLTCTECMVCKGGEYRIGQAVPCIAFHGPSWKKAHFRKGMKMFKQKKAYRSAILY